MVLQDPTTMSPIRILTDKVANQIAAGEVIERPVAVVKELVENSIDAGATRIEVEFRNGGKSYIRIEDNGRGMSPNEALLSLERHATSKIREAEDLNEVLSFGFRGEALPSIASVSKFTLRTRTEGLAYGTEIRVNAGKLLEKKECGMPVGTVIEVAHLFNSVPARRKFLKTEPTEAAHITYNCRLFAVAHPSIAFRVLENGRTLFQSPTCTNLKDRVAEIWGWAMANDLMHVDCQDPENGFKLSGLTAKPGVGRSTRRELVTLVNRRPVDSRTLSFAVLDAYQGRIQKGRYPPAFLFLDISPKFVDVNVHPAKREVRFHNEGLIRRFVLNAIMEALSAEKPHSTATMVERATVPTPSAENPPPTSDIKPVTYQVLPATSTKTILPKPDAAPPTNHAKPKKTAHANTTTPDKQTIQPQKTKHTAPSENHLDWRLISLLKKQYALFETEQGLLVLHIRHADQRVRFERICKENLETEKPSQNLLIPQPIELEPLASETLKSQLQQLNTNGFHIEEFGRNIYRIESVPIWLSTDQAEVFVRDYIDMVRLRSGAQKQSDIDTNALARLAVKDSYRRNDWISPSAVQQLAKDLLNCETPHTSPFGKPTLSEISWSEWEQRFGN